MVMLLAMVGLRLKILTPSLSQVILDFLMVTLMACTAIQPRKSLFSMTVLSALITVLGVVSMVNWVPAGTPVHVSLGKFGRAQPPLVGAALNLTEALPEAPAVG